MNWVILVLLSAFFVSISQIFRKEAINHEHTKQTWQNQRPHNLYCGDLVAYPQHGCRDITNHCPGSTSIRRDHNHAAEK